MVLRVSDRSDSDMRTLPATRVSYLVSKPMSQYRGFVSTAVESECKGVPVLIVYMISVSSMESVLDK